MRLFERFPPRTLSRLVGALLLHACTFVAAQSVPTDLTHWPSASAVEPGMKLQIQTHADRARSTLCTVQSFNDHERAR
jgi:hypothetical protein